MINLFGDIEIGELHRRRKMFSAKLESAKFVVGEKKIRRKWKLPTLIGQFRPYFTNKNTENIHLKVIINKEECLIMTTNLDFDFV